MEWIDDAIVLSARSHGETSAIASVLSCEYGRYAGLVRGGTGKRMRGILQPGNRTRARWWARLPEHLGTLQCELTAPHAARAFDDRRGLSGLSAACTMADVVLPEREPQRAVFDALARFLDLLEEDRWPEELVRWELVLLREIGFGLDLGRCAATGRSDQLIYVSPKTGRAVSKDAGEPYRRSLLALPPFLSPGGGAASARDVADGLRLTGYFLEKHALAPLARQSPAARQRLYDMLASEAESQGD
ncbi:MAG: DNA repair protein RecO [Rhodospirillales bacterium]|jgi:DNA repair protein RecO (recombination protein O)|nr:DNA repair protein RecO [Rhodospirillales bacterium]